MDFPTTVQPPRAASYAAPLLDFSPIGDLGKSYFEGTQNKLKLDQQNLYKNRDIPTDPVTGAPNFGAISKDYASVGMPDQAIAAAREGAGQRALTGLVDQVGGSNAPSAPQPAAGGLSNAAGIPAASPGAGTPAGYTERVASAESGGNANTRNPNSSATGLFQFTEGTWNDLAQKYPKLGLTPDGRTDPEQQRRAMAVFTRDNAATLQAGGVAPNDRSLYLAHFLGAGGAVQFMKGLSANPNAPAAALVAPEQAEANATLFYNKDGSPRSALDFYKNLTSKAVGPNEGGVAQIEQPQGGGQQQPGAPGGQQGGGFTPQLAGQLRALIASGDPKAREVALGLLQTHLAPSFGFQTLPDGTVIRTNAKDGSVNPVYQANKPTFGVIGKDSNGNDVHGFSDPTTKKVWDINGQPIAPGTLAGMGSGGPNSGLTGEPFAQTLEPGRANMVRAVADGRMAPPGGMSLKSPQIQGLLRDVAQYEPGFDLTTWTARNKTRADLSSGKMGQNITAFNTAIGHLDTLSKAADKLNNTSFPAINTVTNWAASQTGDPRVKDFNVAKTAVADELTRAFRGSGGNVHDLVQWEAAINAAGSPQQLQAVIKQAVELLRSRIDAVGDQYSRGMGKTTDPLTLLNPKAAATIRRLSGEKSEPPPAAPQPGPGEAVAAPGGAIGEGATATNPQTGQKIIFKGGQWQPAQ